MQAFGLVGRIGKQIQAAKIIANHQEFARIGSIDAGHQRAVAGFGPNAKHVEAEQRVVAVKLKITSNGHVVELSADGGVPKLVLIIGSRCLNVRVVHIPIYG